MERLNRYRALLLLLFSHELDRIIAWHNPQRLDALKFTDEQLFSTSAANGVRLLTGLEWRNHLHTAWSIDPRLALRLTQRFRMNDSICNEFRSLVSKFPQRVYDVPDAVAFLITDTAAKNNDITALRHLIYWSPCTIPLALSFFLPPYSSNRLVMEYATHSLRCHPPERVVFYLAQIIQLLRNDVFGLIRAYLLQSASQSVLLAHQLIWLCLAETGDLGPHGRKPVLITPEQQEAFKKLLLPLIDEIIVNFTPAQMKFYRAEFNFFNRITEISGVLKELPTKQLRKERIRLLLEKIPVSRGVYLPVNPNLQLVSIIASSGTPMRSAAKVPIRVAFVVREAPLSIDEHYEDDVTANAGNEQQNGAMNGLDGPSRKGTRLEVIVESKDEKSPLPTADDSDSEAVEKDDSKAREVEEELSSNEVSRSSKLNGPSSPKNKNKKMQALLPAASQAASTSAPAFTQTCIFKVNDDVRLDALALQIIQCCKDIFTSVSLPLFLYPYRVVANATGADRTLGGVIECIPNAQTRDEIGKATQCSLKQYYIKTFGREDGEGYRRAQRNFILSLAGYAVVSYLLQAKDRHNGNVMFDDDGHLLHIDFGFIFDISPGKDMKFESAAFKLTLEMVEIMGGSRDHPLYRWFVSLTVRGFLAVREHINEFVSLVEPMLTSSLVCFKPQSLANFRGRFFPDLDELQAAKEFLGIIDDAYNKFTTNMYDRIQKAQQDTYYYQGKSTADD